MSKLLTLVSEASFDKVAFEFLIEGVCLCLRVLWKSKSLLLVFSEATFFVFAILLVTLVSSLVFATIVRLFATFASILTLSQALN